MIQKNYTNLYAFPYTFASNYMVCEEQENSKRPQFSIYGGERIQKGLQFSILGGDSHQPFKLLSGSVPIKTKEVVGGNPTIPENLFSGVYEGSHYSIKNRGVYSVAINAPRKKLTAVNEKETFKIKVIIEYGLAARKIFSF